MPLWMSNVEYVVLRMIRKFVFNRAMLDRLERWLPYYRKTGASAQGLPQSLAYGEHCLGLVLAHLSEAEQQGLQGTVLEIGSGQYSLLGHLFSRRFGVNYIALEPFAHASQAEMQQFDQRVARFAPNLAHAQVQRIRHWASMAEASVDFSCSLAVLEHVYDLNELVAHYKRVLKPGAMMVHIVDYRDHFFKYPFHFYQFSPPFWQRMLDPGSMPRHRLSDHIAAFSQAGFRVEVLERNYLWEPFRRVQSNLHSSFAHYDEETLATSGAVLKIYAPS
ncbi:Methyltransferase type 11 [Magnetococcus marinus MC-1]|uniref:Methyltransferase type 11 n=1 Tax=Magnetococcus marinus (strain ATCC BAA-1437 / JCM 17883 / MC-1) TaxID=156889 RepID=A0LCB9_MAGMM|nr:class I SAM-dependent methyltransferase [Magnetococcus marinus]ABK45612.1 Methyltransferase type 11 [Magnetococcus marinus MC-1]